MTKSQHPQEAARTAFKSDVEAAIRKLATKHGLIAPVTKHSGVRHPSSRTIARPARVVNGDLWVMVDIAIKKW